MLFSPMYWLVAIVGILLAGWAQMKVKRAYALGGRYRPQSGLSGAEAARRILEANGLYDVRIERAKSWLGDHYDPRSRVVRLSPEVHDGRTLSALGIAAHETGHALQQATAYAPLAIRNNLVPLAATGPNLAIGMIVLGIFITALKFLIPVGIVLFTVFVMVQVINLPVEFNASRRARVILLNNGMVTSQEDEVVGKVLGAAAMTYVAATITAILHLLYWVTVAGRR